jgi:hypothetical protein
MSLVTPTDWQLAVHDARNAYIAARAEWSRNGAHPGDKLDRVQIALSNVLDATRTARDAVWALSCHPMCQCDFCAPLARHALADWE